MCPESSNKHVFVPKDVFENAERIAKAAAQEEDSDDEEAGAAQ